MTRPENLGLSLANQIRCGMLPAGGPPTVMPMLRLIAIALLSTCVVAPSSAGAEPLEPEECKALRAKKRTLLTPKVQSALKRGPDWVKEHLHDPTQLEKIRDYLHVEEKVAFRCRTDGVRVPKPMPPPLPDRKPEVPTLVVQGTPKILAGVAAKSFLPLRKPAATTTAEAEAPQGEGTEGEGDIAPEADSKAAETGPSQTVADSDKTTPSENKAMR